MKFILTGFLCLFFTSFAFSQTENGAETKEQSIEKNSLARENKNGNIEEGVEVFSPKDIPVYCYIDLTSDKPTMVKAVFIAVKAKGLRPGTKIVTVNYKTKNAENTVTFRASPGKIWAAGEYRVDIFLDGKIAGSIEYKIESRN